MRSADRESRRTRSEARLRALERPDKWFLSCGDGIVWAPPFPTALHCPGFWDEALVYYHPFAPLFSVAIVMPNGNEVRLEISNQCWRPDRLTVHWNAGDGITLKEERAAYPGGRFVSLWSCIGSASLNEVLEGAHLVGFTAQPGETVKDVVRSKDGASIEWRRTLVDRHNEELYVHAVLSPAEPHKEVAARCAAIRSEGTAPLPKWAHTPFWELWSQQEPAGLPDRIHLDGVSETGLVYAAVDLPLTECGSSQIGFTITLKAVLDDSEPHRSNANSLQASATDSWIEFFESYPEFTCADEHLTNYYDYRLYGLRLNSLAGNCGNVVHPAIAEGIGYFHVPITYSAQCHMWETRWAHNASVARGSLLNFLHHQRDDGSLHGRIYTNHLNNTDFYHANWGDAALAVDAVHEGESFLARSYDGLARYAEWLDRTRDTEVSGMYDVVNHYETGQEYMSRYQAVDPNADLAGWRNDLRLKGIDITVYAYQLKTALATLAKRLGRPNEVERWHTGAQRIGVAILEQMWDESTGMFSDVDPRTMTQTRVKAAVCFYPLLTDLLDDETVHRLVGHLNDPFEFALPFPVPSSSLDDPFFDSNAEWKGKRHNCPWNGRTWPMTNSHIVEGLLRQWYLGRREVGPLAADLLSRFVRMMFFDGDPNRPNCFEHYNPITGHPSVYRGIDDYQHSWVLDLIVRGVAGLEPRSDHLLIDPLPFDTDEVRLVGARIRGKMVNVVRIGDDVEVTADGHVHRTTLGTPLRIAHG